MGSRKRGEKERERRGREGGIDRNGRIRVNERGLNMFSKHLV